MGVQQSRDHVIQVAVDERTWKLLGHEGVRRGRGRGRVLLSLAEAGGLAELRRKTGSEQ